MDDATFRTELLKRVDRLLGIQEKREQRPILNKIARVVVVVVTVVATVFAGYEDYLTYKRRGFAAEFKSLGVSYLLNGEHERAAASLKVADKLRPEDPEIDCYLIAARAFSEKTPKQELEQAEAQCSFIMAHYPPGPEGHNVIGVVYGRTGNYGEAIKAFTKAIELNGGKYDIAEYNLARAYAEYAKKFSAQSAEESGRRSDYLRKAISANQNLLGRSVAGHCAETGL